MQVDAGMIRDAPAHNAPHDQPHGAPTAPASSAPFVASAHGAPPGQPHGAPDCASGSGSDVPVHPALDGSDLSDAAADDKKRNAARALAQKKRSSKASLGAKQAAEKDKEDIEKQCVVLGAMENGDIDGNIGSFSTPPEGIGLAYVKEETTEDSTSELEDEEGGDDEDNDDGFSEPWERTFVGGTAASPAVSQGNGTHGDKSTAWQSEFARSHE